MAEADGSESIIRKEDSQAWDTFCVSCKKLGVSLEKRCWQEQSLQSV